MDISGSSVLGQLSSDNRFRLCYALEYQEREQPI